jgi:hypothetical protein
MRLLLLATAVQLLQDLVKQLQLNTRDAAAFIDQLNEAGERVEVFPESAASGVCLIHTAVLCLV